MIGCTTVTDLPKPDSEIKTDWIAEPRLKNEDTISAPEAENFVNHFFSILSQVIFDPNFKKAELLSAKLEIESKLDHLPSVTRGDVLKIMNLALKNLHISHLVALDPSKTEMIMEMTGDVEPTDPQPAVSVKMIKDIGIIKVETFLVPTMTLAQVVMAREKTANANILIYDLRNNGGGSISSASYVIETILGPNKTVHFSRSRNGIALTSPVVKYGYFEDENNKGSEAEIKFDEEQKYVEWRTRKEAIKDQRKTYVLINSHSASSTDIFAAAIKEHKAATLIGTKTQGAVLGGTAFKLYWKGYTAIMPVSQVISPMGNLYEGVGIEPDYELQSCNNANDSDNKNDKCLDEVIRLIDLKKI